MFGAEPSGRLTKHEMAAFNSHVAKQQRHMLVQAAWATAIFTITIIAIVSFLEGHSLHGYWDRIGKNLVLLAMGELFWFVLRWGYVYASYQAARDTRREMRDAAEGA
jgi:hypothetical protein